MDITYAENLTMLNIAMKRPLKCFGDTDILMQLEMYKSDEPFLQTNLENGHNILRFLSEMQRSEIMIKDMMHEEEVP